MQMSNVVEEEKAGAKQQGLRAGVLSKIITAKENGSEYTGIREIGRSSDKDRWFGARFQCGGERRKFLKKC